MSILKNNYNKLLHLIKSFIIILVEFNIITKGNKMSFSISRGSRLVMQGALQNNARKNSSNFIRPKEGALSPTANSSGRKVVFISGATGQLAPDFIKESLKRGYNVVGFSRKPPASTLNSKMIYAKTPEDLAPESWFKAMRQHSNNAEEVVCVNLIGGGAATNERALEEVNRKPVEGMAKAAVMLKRAEGKKASVIQISTIAATMMPSHVYGKVKDRVDRSLLNLTEVNTLVLRPGLVFQDMLAKNLIDMGHAYSPEQLANFFFHFVLGSGKQVMQPVYSGDLAVAALNGVEKMTGSKIVDAVGPDVMTQEEVVGFFVKLLGKQLRTVNVPYALAEAISSHSAMGRMAPYSVAFFKHLEEQNSGPICGEKFKDLVGNQLTTMHEVYQNTDQQVVIAKAPVKEHFKDMVKNGIANPATAKEMVKQMVLHTPSVGGQMLQQVGRALTGLAK